MEGGAGGREAKEGDAIRGSIKHVGMEECMKDREYSIRTKPPPERRMG